MFPQEAVIDGSEEENKYETIYGFTVTIDRDHSSLVSLQPDILMETQKQMKAKYFFMYPTTPIMPYDIRIYFHIVVEHEES